MEQHAGHRERLRQQLLAGDLDALNDIQVLEYLLYYVNTRKDTNPMAHALLERFGSLSAVLEAPVEQLLTVPGVGPRAAELIHFTRQLERRHRIDANRNVKFLTETCQYGEYLLPLFRGLDQEYVYLLCLDGKCKVLDCVLVHKGSVNAASIAVRKVAKAALDCNASSVILAHNHPTGFAIPSQADWDSTRIVKAALEAIGVVLVDHLVIADDDYVSMRDDARHGGRNEF